MRAAAVLLMSLSLVLVVAVSAYAQEVRTGADAFGTWEDDAPGVQRHIRPTDLPPPTNGDDPEEPDFERMPNVVDTPEGAMPDVPEGFSVQVLATGLSQPRVIRVAPNGDIFVAESGSGRVLVFPADSAGSTPAMPQVFAENLERLYGIVFHPPESPQHVYVGAANQVVRFPYRDGDRKAAGPPRSRPPQPEPWLLPVSHHLPAYGNGAAIIGQSSVFAVASSCSAIPRLWGEPVRGSAKLVRCRGNTTT